MVDLLRVDYKSGERKSSQKGANIGTVWFSLSLLVLMVVFWGGIWFWQRELQSALDDLDAREKKISQEEDGLEIRQAKNLAVRISALEKRLNAHPSLAKFMGFVGSLAGQQTQFSSLNASFTDGKIVLRGEAASLGVLAAGLRNWQGLSEVLSAAVPEIGRRENRVSFHADIDFKPSSFYTK